VYYYALTLADVTQGIAAVKVWPASDFPNADYRSMAAQSSMGEENFIIKGQSVFQAEVKHELGYMGLAGASLGFFLRS
jgi:hypothetical protein